MLDPLVPAAPKQRNNRWVLFALCGTFFSGSGSFLSAVVMKEATHTEAVLSNMVCVFGGAGVMAMVGTVVQALTCGALAGMEGAVNCALGVLAGGSNYVGIGLLTLAYSFDPDTAGPTMALVPLCDVLVCVMSWVILGERLHALQLAGIVVCISGPMVMVRKADSVGVDQVIVALAGSVFYGLSDFLRGTAQRRHAESSSFVLLMTLTMGLISFMIFAITDRTLAGLTPALVVVSVCGGALWVLGAACFQLALDGPVAAVSAIVNTNSIVVLLFTCTFFGTIPSLQKLVGMALSILGITLLILSSTRRGAALKR